MAILTVCAACASSVGTDAQTVAGSDGLSSGDIAALNRDLISAAWDGDVARARELIEAGADVNHQDDTRQSAYLVATSEGHLDFLELALQHDADVASRDSYDGTGLIRAAERGHVDVVQRLLQTDIDVNHVNNLGWTALHEAIVLGDGSERYVRTVQLLLDHGADPLLESSRDGRTPLQLAEQRGQTEVIAVLKAAEAGT